MDRALERLFCFLFGFRALERLFCFLVFTAIVSTAGLVTLGALILAGVL